ncbi:hypothetical protein L1887_16969 [Cichorium endivia]|nr:hypothetical protein L1887_16969 [Cichorium endivia]
MARSSLMVSMAVGGADGRERVKGRKRDSTGANLAVDCGREVSSEASRSGGEMELLNGEERREGEREDEAYLVTVGGLVSEKIVAKSSRKVKFIFP